MVYGIVSDVHANLEAFQAAMAELKRLNVRRLLFLGDIVGYGADANACVELLAHSGASSIRGNHDRIVAGTEDADAFPYSSLDVRAADLWSRSALEERNMERVRRLPAGPLVVDDHILLCHGGPADEDEYLLSWDVVAASVELLGRAYPRVSVCFFGHTHTRAVIRGAREAMDPGAATHLGEGEIYLINPGSVGQPRDGDPRASFGVYDSERRRYESHRVSYDAARAGRKIVNAGLPRRFADRLHAGR